MSAKSGEAFEFKLLLKILKRRFGRRRVADAVDHSYLRAALLGRNREPLYTSMWQFKYAMSAQTRTSRDGALVACRSKV